jgi:hypothetical protein
VWQLFKIAPQDWVGGKDRDGDHEGWPVPTADRNYATGRSLMTTQHPSNRSRVLFVDARQHRDRAWYIEAIYDPFAANDRALRRVGLCACNAR